MGQEPLDIIPLWLLFIAVFLTNLLAMDGGYRLGRWRHALVANEKETPVGAIVASILGLLAFLLAFTFDTAATRFDVRRQTVLEEANAIGTTYLRARLLPEPQHSQVEKLLREYVEIRVNCLQQGKVEEAVTRSEELHELLWAQATAAAQQNPTSIMTGLFIQTLNETIDLHAKRVHVGMRNRIPISIWGGLYALALLGMAAVGYQAGLSGTPRSPVMPGMVVAFTGVFMLIADLDRGHEGFLTVSQQALIDLQKSMHAPQQ